MMGNFLRLGVTLHNWITDPTVHTSGHAHRHEQEHMLGLVRPRAFVPVHGTRHHLERHAELARELGIGEVLVIENGDVAEAGASGLRLRGHVTAGRVATWQGLPIPDVVLRERRALGRAGALSVSIVVDRSGNLVAPPALSARGVVQDEEDPNGLRFVALEIAKTLEAAESRDDASLRESVRLSARRAVEGRTGRKPICLVNLTRVDGAS